MNAPDQRAEQIFAEALEFTNSSERRSYVERTCAGDAQLLAEVESLLKAHGEAGAFLQTDTPNDDTTLGVTSLAVPLTEGPSTRIGRYKLHEQIGEGGFGVVWMAEQEEPVRRRVALKIIKLGMDTREVIARFEAERQALALMDHPNIARVFDGGATESGRPYFVMELVKGEPITKYCDENRLSLNERLELFVQVCQAVQHAHQKGVIHRDLKPSNILVGIHDDKPVPKVIDFGIAKATQQRLTEKTLFTRFQQFIGTPAYMSPEQAGLSSLDVDTRSDIYSLGVLLYELLTGRTPFSKEELLAGGYDEICRIIREKEPPKPSTRLNTMPAADRSTIAAQRKIPSEKLGRLVRGELDWVVMKCLEKDRARRYETANSLAMDLRRYLDQEPITARPPSNLYRFQKLVRRNKLAIATAGAIAASLMIGLVIATWMFFRERQASQRALANQIKAQTEAGKSQQVARFLKEMLSGVKPSAARGRDTVLLKEVLDKTAERVGNELKDQPEVEAELRDTLGEVYGAISEAAKAEKMYRRLLELRKQLRGDEHLDVAEALNNVAGTIAWTGQGKLVEAEELARQSLAMRRKLLQGNDHLETAASLLTLSGILHERHQLPEAEERVREALALYEKFGTEGNKAEALHLLAVTLWEAGRPAEAEVFQFRAHKIYTKLHGEESVEVAHSLNELAAMADSQGREQEAEDLNRQALEMRRKLLPPEHTEIGQSLNNLAGSLMTRGRLDDAEALLRESLQIHRKIADNQRLVWTLSSLGGLLNMRGKLEEAESMLHDAVRLGKAVPLSVEHPFQLGAVQRLAGVLTRTGKLTEAEQLLKEALADAPVNSSAHIALIDKLAGVLALENKPADIERLATEALGSTADKSDAQVKLLTLRGGYRARHALWSEALGDFAKAVELRPQDHWLRHLFAPLLVQIGDYAGYEANRTAELEIFEATEDPIVAGRVAKDCLILPVQGAALETINKWAKTAVAINTNHWSWPYAVAVKGLAEYRRGNYPAALEWTEKALFKEGQNAERDVQALMVVAMAQQHLGHNGEAKQALARGDRIASTKLRLDSADLGGDWGNWIRAHVLLREAKGLIEGLKAQP